jgi:hypothetical protein
MSTEERVISPPASFHRDLENARVLIEDSPWKENPYKYRKVAEGILRRVLTLDPQNEVAKLLLAKAEAPLPEVAPPATTAAPPPVAPPPALAAVASPTPASPPRPRDLSFVVQTIETGAKPENKPSSTGKPPWVLVCIALAGATAGLWLLVTQTRSLRSDYFPKSPAPLPVVVQASAPASASVTPEAEAAPLPSIAELPSEPIANPEPPPPVPPPPSATVVVKSNVAPVAPIQTGTLAVSSPTTVDIYIGDQLVGSAPTTLVLPAGNQSVEYRHNDMRKILTHVIKPNETTTATVTFDLALQINARPWAQVFIDGPQRQPLGQTPLSEVRVPIGSVLVFENPNFPGKNYRVTGRETEIRMTFP